MNILDILIVVIVGFCLVRGIFRGIVKEITSIIGVFVGFFLVAIIAAPRMEKLTPAPDSHGVPSTAHISLTFNQPMDLRSVETRLKIDPPLSGHLVWDGNTLVFEPLEPWPEGSTVTVQLTAGARSTRFLPMLRGQSWSFTVGAPRILYLWPVGDQADLYTVSLDGSETTRLTETPLGVSITRWATTETG